MALGAEWLENLFSFVFPPQWRRAGDGPRRAM